MSSPVVDTVVSDPDDSDQRHQICEEKPVRIRVPVNSKEEEERCRKQALAARANRRRKKCELQSLEAKVTELSEVNAKLTEQVVPLQNQVESLEDEVAYLKSVLKNQSKLSELLKNIPQPNVTLSSRFTRSSSRKRAPTGKNTDGAPAGKRTDSGGLCLHVAGEKVSVELCRACSHQAA